MKNMVRMEMSRENNYVNLFPPVQQHWAKNHMEEIISL